MSTPVPESGWLNTSQLRMHYLDWGEPVGSTGKTSSLTLLALHGLASSCHWYDIVIPHVSDTYRCIALDQRAHGLTDQPSTGYDWQSLTDDVAEALDQLGIDKVAVAGHSWGANVALALAAKHPDKVARLAMVDGGFNNWRDRPGATWESFKERLRPRQVPSKKEDFLNVLKEQLADCWSDQLEHIVMTMVRVQPDGSIRDILEPANHAQVMEAMWNEPSSTLFPDVKCPTILVAADNPWSNRSPEFAQMRRDGIASAQKALGNCEVRWIADSSHDIGYHKPKELAQVLSDFFSGD